MQDGANVYFRTWGEDNVSYGPVELPALVSWLRQGRVSRKTWVFSEQRGEWSRAEEMVELKGLFKAVGGPPSAVTVPGITPGSLRRIRILADLDERQLGSFLSYMEVLKLLPNATVFSKGDHGDAMFLVLEGEVRARVMMGGRELTLATLTVGECFGEMAVIDEGPRSADVLVNRDCVLLKISAGALKRLFREAPALAAPFLLGLTKTISSRMRTLGKRYEDSMLFAQAAKEANETALST